MVKFLAEKIFITGGAGYVGTVLTHRLLKLGYHVTVYDAGFYGFGDLKRINNPKFNLVVGDLRNFRLLKDSIKNHDVVLHLACISNDPSFELKPHISKEINFDIFEPLVKISKNEGVKRFIFGSSGSVYGVSKALRVTEKEKLVPLTQYNIFKAKCEPILLENSNQNFICTVIRPSTICGFSPRMRFDLTVNLLTNHAFHKKIINVFGGNQYRPNIHVIDMCRVYELVIKAKPNLIQNEIFNAGYKNYTIAEIAEIIKKVYFKLFNKDIKIQIDELPTYDKRSYRLDSSKIKKKLNFNFEHDIDVAITELFKHFTNKDFKFNTMSYVNYFNLKKIKKLFNEKKI